ncbi:MAG: hypothetical protein HY901_34610 [Deltaproteobacteria bacterium]|nr:hypothetical protein [Deltaproteobacteria bacterium]
MPPQRRRKVSSASVLFRFLTHVSARGLTLYPAQEEALLELFGGKRTILGTSTAGCSLLGSGAL